MINLIILNFQEMISMTPYENIKNIVANKVPSMRWDGSEPITEWQEKARAKLAELVGLDKMIPAEKKTVI